MKAITIKELKDIASIEQIIGNYVKLKKQGTNYKGLCPFHNEKTPSFVVSPDKRFFRCFGCGESGDVFSFLMKYKNYTFPQATDEVAHYYGYEIKKTGSKKNVSYDLKTKLISLNHIAKQEYTRLLNNTEVGKIARDYLKQRKINTEMIKLFGIGYAPDDWDTIAQLLNRSDISDELTDKTDLIKKSNKSDRYYDRFRHRIIFPISDENNNIIGFGGRTLGIGNATGDKPAKYLNSAENEIFKKRENLYNLNLAKNYIDENNDSIIITEGYMDVIACFQFGIKNVVAPLGTALTFNQLKKLDRYAKKVIFMFDGDSAGMRASVKSIEIAFQTNMEIFVVILPEKLDPYDYLFKYGKESLNSLIAKPKEALDFKLKQVLKNHETNTAKGKENFINEALYFLSNTRNRIIIEIGIKKLSEITKISESSLRKYYSDKSSKYLKNIVQNSPTDENKIQETPYERFQRIIITTLLANINEADKYIFKLSNDMFTNNFYDKILNIMKKLWKEEEYLGIELIKDELGENSEEVEFFEDLIKSSREYQYEPEKILQQTINNLKYLYIEERIIKNEQNIKQAEQAKNWVLQREYMEEAQYLLSERKKLYDFKFNVDEIKGE